MSGNIQRSDGRRGARVVACMLMALWFSGCVTEVADIPGQTRATLMVSRSGEEVQGSWKGEKGRYYTVLYAPARDARTPWKVLPGYDMLPGTDGLLILKDRVPLNENRYYRLFISDRPLTPQTGAPAAPSRPDRSFRR